MWPLAECIGSILVRTPSPQLGVLQSLQSSFHPSQILLFNLAPLYLWWKPGSWSTSPSPPIKRPKLGIREWTPLHCEIRMRQWTVYKITVDPCPGTRNETVIFCSPCWGLSCAIEKDGAKKWAEMGWIVAMKVGKEMSMPVSLHQRVVMYTVFESSTLFQQTCPFTMLDDILRGQRIAFSSRVRYSNPKNYTVMRIYPIKWGIRQTMTALVSLESHHLPVMTVWFYFLFYAYLFLSCLLHFESRDFT